VIEQKPAWWLCVMTGKTAPGAGSSKLRRRPSHGRQPKLTPRALPLRSKSISSTASWPTSPIAMSPVARSNEKRYGLRRP
jgi:hypothetical protein